MVIENLQRPRWFRACERAKGKFFKHGSYGIMQVEADSPVSDEESIRIAVRTHLVAVSVPVVQNTPGYFSVDYNALRAFALTYNPSESYATALTTAYGLFWKSPSA
jgi:hypothetical protein